MKKVFVPCYKVIIQFFNYDDKVFRVVSFDVDYFRNDIHGVNMFQRIADEWCVPYLHTAIHFKRIRD